MPDIRVNIETPGQTLLDCMVPSDHTPENIISDLLEEMYLPHTGQGGRTISYSLLHVNSDLILPADLALAAAGVRDGDTLRAVRFKRIILGETRAVRPRRILLGERRGEVDVVLTVLDLNRVELIRLPLRATAAGVIRQILVDYNLPARDALGQTIKYRLMSKAWGRSIGDSETLHQAGIPALDRLTVHREEVAGGRPFIPFKRRPHHLARMVQSVVAKYKRLRSGKRTTAVECTVFARPSVSQGETCLIQVFAYDPFDAAVAYRMAKEFDDDAVRRGFKSLETEVTYGSKLTFHLIVPGVVIEGPIQSIDWFGLVCVASFSVTIPESHMPGDLVATVRIASDQVPLGHIKFKLTVVKVDQATSSAAPIGTGHAYKKAFISYARQDISEVFKRVQMLDRLRIKFFQDVLNLKAGENWEAELRRHIKESDLFLLFWSSGASRSKGVLSEIRYALEVKHGDDLAPPEIIPIPIEGPPPVPPPPELAHLHFDDYFLYLQSQAETISHRHGPPH
jgi:hypothetical protein